MASDHLKTRAAADLRQIQQALHAIGAPLVSLEELTRLHQGVLGDVLTFLCEHLIGRQECAVARQQLHQVTQNNARDNKFGRGIAQTRSSVNKATSRLAQASNTLRVNQSELTACHDALDVKQREADQLLKALTRKQRVKLFLEVLERKETLRVKRVQEMACLMEKLRQKVEETHENEVSKLPTTAQSHASSPPSILSVPRFTHTEDALTSLHAYHIRVFRLAASDPDNIEPVEARLHAMIARSLKAHSGDPKVVKEVERSLALARARARDSVSYRPLNHVDSSHPQALDDMFQKLIETECEIQNLSDHSTALVFLCEYYINSASASRKSSAALLLALEDDARDARTYIDVLQSSITRECEFTAHPSSPGFLDAVKSACALRGEMGLETPLRVLEGAIRDEHLRSALLSTTLREPQPASTKDQELIDRFRSMEKAEKDRSVQLLTRKREKAAVALVEGVVRDGEVLLEERKLVGKLV